MNTTINTPARIRYRDIGGAYFARCGNKTASSTSSPAIAVARAVSKASGSSENHVRLQVDSVPNAYRVIVSDIPVSGYATSSEILTADIARLRR